MTSQRSDHVFTRFSRSNFSLTGDDNPPSPTAGLSSSGSNLDLLRLAIAITLLIVLMAGLAVQVNAAPVPQEEGAVPTETQNPEDCAECHVEEYELWQQGDHAQAFNKSSFQEAWDRTGRLDTCLECHATAYNVATGEVLAEDVTCQVCHQRQSEQNHPPALMSVDGSAEKCGECHENTAQEWQLSGHGQRGIECASCHKSHSQALRIEPAQELCHQCHGQRFEDLAHSSHAEADLTCSECHMPENPAAELTHGIGGVSTIGHTFNVGSQTCAECHVSQIHGQSAEMASAQRFPDQPSTPAESRAVEAAQERVNILSAEVEQLRRQVDRQQILTYVGGAFGLGIGVFIGLIGTLVLIFVLQRREA